MTSQQFPPVRGPSFAQQKLMYFEGVKVPSEEYTSWDYSPAFKEKYGVPMAYYTDWERILSEPVDLTLVPRIKGNILEIAETTRFLKFAKAIDNKCVQLNMQVLGRRAMESAWVRFLLTKYDEQDLNDLLGFKLDILSLSGARAYMKWALGRGIENRLHPVKKVEAYWAEKKGRILDGDIDVETIVQGSLEPAEEANEDTDMDEPLKDEVAAIEKDMMQLDIKEDVEEAMAGMTLVKPLKRLHEFYYN